MACSSGVAPEASSYIRNKADLRGFDVPLDRYVPAPNSAKVGSRCRS